MAASNQLITDLSTVYSTGFSNTTFTNTTAPQGVIQDINGNVQLCIVGLTDCKRRLIEVLKDVDPNDPMLATLQGVMQSLV